MSSELFQPRLSFLHMLIMSSRIWLEDKQQERSVEVVHMHSLSETSHILCIYFAATLFSS